MRSGLFSKPEYIVTPITSDDSDILHDIHKQSFYHAWDETVFASFLADPQISGFIVSPEGKPGKVLGFVLCRLVIDEAEIITIAVHPRFRQKGLGKKLLDAVFRYLYHQRAKVLFLEVDENNSAALALYKGFGFYEVGRRPGYYKTDKGHSDALIMRRTIQQKD
ncbi:GNAT domain [Bartonella apihabitans]|uniref:ribosomal protein S18-alanine N-acetyltransferase n=1 Tax=Bartonella apihabitans TaxID=2750929 RepID=UPI0039982B37